ncbi:hypothetical protein ACQEVZ_24585 [Dactylosporangium sp. CA-152071]|uniref:hypothetical protein n=1 Tax=Dactylosporangium sp. CA-152071 TaxID=3239933 RepID=UPI003D8E0291
MQMLAVPSTAMTTPPDAPQQFGHPSTWPTPTMVESPAPRTVSPSLFAAFTGAALVLMAIVGLGVWYVMRPDSAAPAPAAGSVAIAGVVVLELPNFEWQSVENPVCKGRKDYEDITEGAQVTYFDASGKTLAVGKLGAGEARGITRGSDGVIRASACAVPFSIEVPSGVGPYGVEVSNRGVRRFNEGSLTGLQIKL